MLIRPAIELAALEVDVVALSALHVVQVIQGHDGVPERQKYNNPEDTDDRTRGKRDREHHQQHSKRKQPRKHGPIDAAKVAHGPSRISQTEPDGGVDLDVVDPGPVRLGEDGRGVATAVRELDHPGLVSDDAEQGAALCRHLDLTGKPHGQAMARQLRAHQPAHLGARRRWSGLVGPDQGRQLGGLGGGGSDRAGGLRDRAGSSSAAPPSMSRTHNQPLQPASATRPQSSPPNEPNKDPPRSPG